MSVAVFDASKVPHLIQLINEFHKHWNPTDSADAEKMLDAYNALYDESKTAPALYRSRRSILRMKVVKLPRVKRMLVLAFGDEEGQLTSMAEQEIEPKPNTSIDVVLNFSPGSDCGKKSAPPAARSPRR